MDYLIKKDKNLYVIKIVISQFAYIINEQFKLQCIINLFVNTEKTYKVVDGIQDQKYLFDSLVLDRRFLNFKFSYTITLIKIK